MKEIKAPKGITIRDIYITLARYDGVIVFDVPGPKEAMRLAADVGVETGYLVETLGAIPAKEV